MRREIEKVCRNDGFDNPSGTRALEPQSTEPDVLEPLATAS